MNISLKHIAVYQLYLARVTAALCVVTALSVFLYGTFLLMAVSHTASRTQAQHSIAEVSARVSDLEGSYLAATKDITPDRATALGLVAPVQVATLYTQAPTTALSFNGR